MFSRSDGPTALRADLVRALAFSVQQGELETGDGGTEPAVAALAGVWNGRKGFVAVVVFRIPSQSVDRYVFADAINSTEELGSAVEEGLGFAESLGFGMDSSEFLTLDLEQQEQRLQLWNKLRKPRVGIVPPVQPRVPEIGRQHTGDIDPLTSVTPEKPLALAPPAPTEPISVPPALEAARDRAVLGRIELVRRDPEETRPDPIARLLSHL